MTSLFTLLLQQVDYFYITKAQSMPGSTRPLVVVLGFLDTKLEEHTLVYHKLSHLGCDVIVVDLSIRVSHQSPMTPIKVDWYPLAGKRIGFEPKWTSSGGHT